MALWLLGLVPGQRGAIALPSLTLWSCLVAVVSCFGVMASNCPDAPNTVRLVVPAGQRAVVGLFFVQKQVFEDLLGLDRAAIFCVQCFPSSGFFDVTFCRPSDLQTCLLRYQEKKDDPLLQGFQLLSSEVKQRIPLVVQMYNPFVRDAEVVAFLARYCEVLSEGVKQTNVLGTFNGQRKYFVRLRQDAEGVGGVKHPPQMFSIGSNRGVLWYPGQPLFCRNCFSFGHRREDCVAGQVCRNCYQPGHFMSECPAGRACHLCGSRDHLARQCPGVPRLWSGPVPHASAAMASPPGRVRSFAEVAGGGASAAARSACTAAPVVLCPDASRSLPGDVSSVDEGSAASPGGDCVPESLVSGGETGGAGGGGAAGAASDAASDTASDAELNMDLSRDSLKRKKKGCPGAGSPPPPRMVDSPCSPGGSGDCDSDSTCLSFLVPEQLDSMQAVMGFPPRKQLKHKEKTRKPPAGTVEPPPPREEKPVSAPRPERTPWKPCA